MCTAKNCQVFLDKQPGWKAGHARKPGNLLVCTAVKEKLFVVHIEIIDIECLLLSLPIKNLSPKMVDSKGHFYSVQTPAWRFFARFRGVPSGFINKKIGVWPKVYSKYGVDVEWWQNGKGKLKGWDKNSKQDTKRQGMFSLFYDVSKVSRPISCLTFTEFRFTFSICSLKQCFFSRVTRSKFIAYS